MIFNFSSYKTKSCFYNRGYTNILLIFFTLHMKNSSRVTRFHTKYYRLHNLSLCNTY